MTAFDSLVVGQGLAGTAVAWCLRWRGRRVLVVDRADGAGASRVAAGLITPITGRRLVKTWRLDEFFPAAVAFYRRVEAATAAPFLTCENAVRLFADGGERAAFVARADPIVAGHVGRPEPLVDPDWFAAPHGGFEMTPAARLDVARYLDASRDHFAADGGYQIADLDPGRDIDVTAGGVRVPRLGVRAAYVVFCDGLAARENPRLPDLRFTPAKGEVLTLRIPQLAERRVVHCGVWLAPAGGDLFRAGATYDRDDLTPAPTVRGRDEIVGKLREFLRRPFEITAHAAGVRPVVAGMTPVAAVHPGQPRVAYLNGLGSKGALLAPNFAAELAGNAVHSSPRS